MAELPSTLTSSTCASGVSAEPTIATTFDVESGMILLDGVGAQRLAVCRAQPLGNPLQYPERLEWSNTYRDGFRPAAAAVAARAATIRHNESIKQHIDPDQELDS